MNKTCIGGRSAPLAGFSSSPPVLQVWVRQTVVENDLNLFKELPTHLRAQVAWRSNKPVMDKINTFQVGCAKSSIDFTYLNGTKTGSGL